MDRIIIHPYFDAIWSAFFIKGLVDLYGFSNISFSKEGFFDVPDRSDEDISGYLYMILVSGDKRIKFVLDENDKYTYDDDSLEWSDVYAKSNINPEHMPLEKYIYKLIPLAPFFPVRYGNYYQLSRTFLRTFDIHQKSYMGHFKRHIYRLIKHHYPIDSIVPQPSKKNFIYMSSTFWKRNTDTNEARANFMRAAKSIPEIKFVGGFFKRSDDLQAPEDLRFAPLPKKEYIQATYDSSVAFNSSSVLGAMSFRTCEYLLMGKAILMPPLKRLTTTPLIHGEHIHFAEPDFDSLREAIELINGDDKYRRKLETGARSYYENFGRPRILMEKVITFGKNIVKQS